MGKHHYDSAKSHHKCCKHKHVNGNLSVCGETSTKKLNVNGKPFDKQWVIPLTDNFENPPQGHAAVYLNVEETFNPGAPSGKSPVSLIDFGEPHTITVSQVGDLVSIVTGTGNPGGNFAWSQTQDFSNMYNNAPLVIDFTGTPVQHLIVNGGTHTDILTIPGAYNESTRGFVSKTGLLQIGPGSPILKIWPEVDPDISGIVTLDSNGEYQVTNACCLQFIAGLNSVQLTVSPGPVPKGFPYVANIDDNGFLIKSVAGSEDAGVNVNYTIKPNYSYAFSKSWGSGNNAFQNINIVYKPLLPNNSIKSAKMVSPIKFMQK